MLNCVFVCMQVLSNAKKTKSENLCRKVLWRASSWFEDFKSLLYDVPSKKINLNAACFILIVYKVESISDSDYSFSQQLHAEQKQVGLTPSLPCPGETEG